ncbi:MAG: PAS domain S-box protein [Desulfobulbaceae bacterium]
MKRILQSLPFLFIFGLLLWVINSLAASMFLPGNFALESESFALTLQNVYTRIMIVSFSILLYMILFRIFIYEKEQKLLRNAFNHSFPMCVIDFKSNIVEANATYWETLGKDRKTRAAASKCYAEGAGEDCRTDGCPLQRIKNGEQEVTCEGTKEVGGVRRHFIIKAKPVANAFGDVVGIIESYNDITERKELEQDKQRLIDDLRATLEQVKQLKGMLPICPSCKQVRDDKGYWEQIESYLQEHTEVEVTSSLCPACKEQLQLPLCDISEPHTSPTDSINTRDTQWLKVILQ